MEAAVRVLDISPDGEVELGASNARDLPWRGVQDPLEATLLLLRAGDERLLFVTFDLLYVGAELRRCIVEASGLPPERVVVAASHTHRAPMTDSGKPGLGHPDLEYVTRLHRRMRETIAELSSGPFAPCTIWGNATVSEHSVNRRSRKLFFLSKRPGFNRVVNAPNPAGTRDDTLVTATIRAQDGAPIAVLWNYACHPVGAPRANAVSAHFPGAVRSAIRAEEGEAALPVLFFQGFSGNTRPSASSGARSVKRRLRQVVSGPLFDDMTEAAYRQWTESLSSDVMTSRRAETRDAGAAIAARRHTLSGTEFVAPGEGEVSFVHIGLGERLAIAGMSGEVVAEYAPRVRELAARPWVMAVGCLDDTFGYVPTAEIIREGGYEGGGYCRAFGLDHVEPQIETATMCGFKAVIP